jgi:ubiquinone/menaquinone biosynthesis C-methylase UbiE
MNQVRDDKSAFLYDKKLAKEWIDWIETENPEGSREKEIYPFIKKWMKTIKPKSVVDIGCGQGVCSNLIDQKIKYIGIDPSKKLIKRAKELYKAPNREFIIGDAYKIPLENNNTDAVLSIWVWSHLEDLEKAAREMYRILKPGCHFLTITANPDTYDIRKTFYKSFKEDEGCLVGTFDLGEGRVLTNTILYLHTKKRIIRAIDKSKLKIDKIDTIGLKDTYPGGLNILIKGHKI